MNSDETKNKKNNKKIQEIVFDIEKKLEKIKQLISDNSDTETNLYAIDTKNAKQYIEGVFNGREMVDEKGKKYLVSENYASKSKLVSGDKLKLVIAPNGTFVFKQIAPIERKREIGTIKKTKDNEKYIVYANNKKYKVLQASIMYFKLNNEDKVTILLPAKNDSTWAAIENKLINL